MEKYRKLDQHYIDEYDKQTIKLLKEIEQKEAFKRTNAKTIEEKRGLVLEEHTALDSFYYNAVMRARNKEGFIRALKQKDENNDRLVAKYPAPQNVKCKTCNSLMRLCSHFFKEGEAEILFVFECPKGHSPKRAMYPNGKEFYFPIRKCEHCGSELKSRTKKTKAILTVSDYCTGCDFKQVYELDLAEEVHEIINESERQKYCTSFIDSRTFWEDLEAVADFLASMDEETKEKLEKEKYGFGAVQRISIPHLEQRIANLTEAKGYIKLSFEKPVFTKFTTIQFSIQDPSERTETESKQLLQRLLQQDLFSTNWRSAKDSLSYRMGYLTGKLKGFEHDDDIMRIAKEIHKKQSNGRK